MVNKGDKSNRLLGVILAGGASTRMGGYDKFLLPMGEKRILDHIVERLSPQVDALVLNTNTTDISTELAILPDRGNSMGPLSGLYTVLRYAKDNGYSKIVSVASDTPFIPHDLVVRFMEQPDNRLVVAKSDDRLHPIIGLWDVTLLQDVKRALERPQLKVMSFVKNNNASEVVWDQALDPFFNINTAEDLEKAKKLAHQGQLF